MKTIRDVMRPAPIHTRPGEGLHQVLELLIQHGISGLPVVDEAGSLVGAISEKDLLKIFYEDEARTVDSVMTRDPVSISVDAELVEVVDCLMANDFRRVFIHEGEKLVGLVSRADLMPAILSALLERT